MNDDGDSQSDELSRQDERTLAELGYSQELDRDLGAFSNLAISLSIICILAGGVTSFSLGFCAVGGASIGLGWPISCLFSITVALTMAQVASAFPTAGGLYHWAAILGGRGWGWTTAWFNLAGLVTVLAAIDVGAVRFAADAFGWSDRLDGVTQLIAVAVMAGSQAWINHRGIRLTARLTDFSGWWILGTSAALTLALILLAPTLDPTRLLRFENFSGPAGGDIWPRSDSLVLLFALGLLLPAYTITGFDASAHVAEETKGAAVNVPRGIVRSVVISGIAGWIFLSAVVLAAPSTSDAAAQGEGAFRSILQSVLPRPLHLAAVAAILVAQYLCGLATVTSAARMAFAFARDGGLPASRAIRRVSPRYRSPAVAVWVVSVAAVLFTAWTPIYATITAVCTIFLYVSYVIPIGLGCRAIGTRWTRFGPWNLGRWYLVLAIPAILGCVILVLIGMQPPNQKSVLVLGLFTATLSACWWGGARDRFAGPPVTTIR